MRTSARRESVRLDRLNSPDSRVPAAVLLLICLLLVGVLTVALVFASRSISEDLALDRAEVQGRRVADGLVAALVNEAVRDDDPDAVRRLSVAMGHRIRDG